ncbi:protein stoned-B [Condylostylus longicornis]|uniref:protein stoned-B n=1 Tax=Condylostylus longicornis TaxID=2530218 RepID=UPI00244DC7AE|nr:protein stoned-B [Condylostylus longicornis]
MANPFLMDDDPLDSGDSAPNPFLLDDTQQEETDYDNSFQGTNPFAFGDDADDDLQISEKPESMSNIFDVDDTNTNDAAMSFFDTTIQEDETNISSRKQSEDQTNLIEDVPVKKIPPSRPTPPSQTTQDLICAVADQLDEASSTMLDRIPVTRTPSPVSMRDLVSPSPTPDLFDVTDDQNNDFLGETIDNPFGIGMQPTLPNNSAKTQPARPPPPRPGAPPRPPAPSVMGGPGPVQATPVQNNEKDLFDMFGTSTAAPPKPPPPKSKEDILSLFDKGSKPPIPPKPDLLSDDLVLDNGQEEKNDILAQEGNGAEESAVDSTDILSIQEEQSEKGVVQQTQEEPDAIFSSTVTEPEVVAKVDEAEEESNEIALNEPTMDSIAAVQPIIRAPTPDIEITTVGDRPGSDEEDEFIPHGIVRPHKEVEVELESDQKNVESSDYSPPTESNITTQAIPDSPNDNVNNIQESEQMDTTLDFAPASGSASANPFASPEDENPLEYTQTTGVTNIFAVEESVMNSNINAYSTEMNINQEHQNNIFAAPPVARPPPPTVPQRPALPPTNIFAEPDEFDAFAAKFDSAKKEKGGLLDGFGISIQSGPAVDDAWGSTNAFGTESSDAGFGADDTGFDSWAPEPSYNRRDSVDSTEEKDFNVVIRPKDISASSGLAPALAPPPRTSQNNSIYSGDSSPRVVNPFEQAELSGDMTHKRTDSQETPPTPLFDEDISQPLEDFPRLNYTGSGWEMHLRQPNKKKITGQRFWKKIYTKLVYQGDVPVVQLFNQATDKSPFQELPLQPSYSVSEIAAQQFDQFGKIFTLKLQYIFYKERPGVRPGQITKAERITNKLSQFAQYAIAGDYAGVKEFGSDLKKLGLPVEHAPQSSQLAKLGTMTYEDLKQFSILVEEALFKLSAHRDRALTYKMEEVQVTAVDEIYVEQDSDGHVHKQIARVRLFFLAFLSGMPTIELGLNDMWRQGKEVVGRHDIIPVVTEEWIRLEGVEFHNVVQQDEYERSRTIKFQPPDACYIELMRFRVRPPKNRELPLQLKASWCVTGNRVELKADILVPGFTSKKLGQIPCEDVSIRFPIPECWIYLFRVEKHFRYGSVKSAHRRTGKIKGIERILGTVETLQESLIEVTSGQAKYEHHHRAIVWRCPRLPKEGQGAYTTHQMVCRMALTSYDQIPEQLAPYAYVEFTMPATQVSHTTVRSVSVQDSDSDEPPEKYVRYLARHEYRVGIETTQGETVNAYLAATKPIKEEPATTPVSHSPALPSDSDSDSN